MVTWRDINNTQRAIVALTYGGILATYGVLVGFFPYMYGGLAHKPQAIINEWVLTGGLVLVFMLAHGLFFGFPKREKTDDAASVAPVTVLLIAVCCIGFQALVFGNELVESSIVTPIENEACADGLGPLETIACWVRYVGVGIGNAFLVVFSVFRFFFNALTFNVPGAPVLVRVIIGTAFVGSIGWAIAGMFRGSSTA